MSPTPSGTLRVVGRMRIVLSAYPSRAAALDAMDEVLGRRLAACANLLPVESRYWWKGRIESARESLVLFKTLPKRVGSLLRYLKEAHPYDVPEVAEVDVPRADPDYLRYLAATLDGASPNRRKTARRPEAPRGRGARGPGRTRARPHRRSR